MSITVLKSYFKKKQPKIVLYHDYKAFSNTNVIEYLNSILISHDTNNIDYDVFQQIVMNLLDVFVPIKCKYIRANDGPFMNKELQKAVMHRFRLKNKFNNEKSELSKLAYNRQQNKCTKMFRKAKRDYYSKLKPSSMCDNKVFWKNVKHLFSDKKSSQ